MCTHACVGGRGAILGRNGGIQSGSGFLLTSAITLFFGRRDVALSAVPVVQALGTAFFLLSPC